MRGNRCEQIPPVKGLAHRRSKVLLVRDLPNLLLWLRQDEGEDAVVRTDKELASCLHQDRAALRSHARVDHYHVHRLPREVTIGLGDVENDFGDLIRTA